MLKFIQNRLRQRELHQRYFLLFKEIEQNLENYYVMFQLNRLRFFVLDEWGRVQARPQEHWSEVILNYAQRLTSYNDTLKDYKDFEQWYNENLERKNQDNGRILHAKKELASERFKGLEGVIKAARADVEKLLC